MLVLVLALMPMPMLFMMLMLMLTLVLMLMHMLMVVLMFMVLFHGFVTTRHSTRTRSLPRQFRERSTCGPHVTKCGFAKFKLYGSHASFQKIDGNAPRGLWP